jgi:ADP-ribosylglycohydrolase
MDREKYIRGAIYGLLVGDAVGVPYEFKVPSQLPDIEQIDMIPPKRICADLCQSSNWNVVR